MRIVGVIPARMRAGRFPGKPLHPILGRPMIEHVYLRAARYAGWDSLHLATCDREIEAFGRARGWSVIMTSDQHVRCLDRVAEAAELVRPALASTDLVVCVQGDEPMLAPAMIAAVTEPLLRDASVECCALALPITEEAQFVNPDTVKVVADVHGDVRYTSRSPIPYTRRFTAELGARRLYGLFAFRLGCLRRFSALPPAPLEIAESCDSNRLCGHGLRQRLAVYPHVPSFSVDRLADVALVEAAMPADPLWGTY